jgi:ribosome-associated toxin RatA of RatAB toxin-antitoxin module
MFALVRDVAAYPQFLPWCASSEVQLPIQPQVEAQNEPEILQARVDLVYLGVRSHFTTRNEHQFPDSIRLNLIEGPFRHLQGQWNFLPLGETACKVTLVLEYRFAAGLLGRVLAPVFDKVANSLVDAFARRAQALYGEGDRPDP